LDLNFHGVLNGVTWLERLCTVVWLVLNALALGENVLVHCRQGKHRSGVLVMLLLGILAPVGLENYDYLEATYFQKNSKVIWSEW
jgi:protein tyrosine/serine phosphatase